MTKLFFLADRYLAALSRFLMIFFALTLTTIMAISVLLRYVFDMALPAIEELSILIGLWFYFIAMIVVTRERGHLTGGIIELLNLSPATRKFFKLFNDVVGFSVICFFGYYAFKYLFFVMKINRSSTNLGWPTAIWVSAAIAGFSIMAIYKLRDIFSSRNSYSFFDNKSPHSDDAVLEDLNK